MTQISGNNNNKQCCLCGCFCFCCCCCCDIQKNHDPLTKLSNNNPDVCLAASPSLPSSYANKQVKMEVLTFWLSLYPCINVLFVGLEEHESFLYPVLIVVVAFYLSLFKWRSGLACTFVLTLQVYKRSTEFCWPSVRRFRSEIESSRRLADRWWTNSKQGCRGRTS